MDKWRFKQLLEKSGYAVDSEAAIPTVLLVGATNEEIKKKFFEVKLLAQKTGYHHSVAVRSLEENNE